MVTRRLPTSFPASRTASLGVFVFCAAASCARTAVALAPENTTSATRKNMEREMFRMMELLRWIVPAVRPGCPVAYLGIRGKSSDGGPWRRPESGDENLLREKLRRVSPYARAVMYGARHTVLPER